MNIQMIGIDHSNAAVEYRELFSLTKTPQTEAMTMFANMEGVLGCVILSTCNRVEVYLSTEEGVRIDLYQALCRFKEIESEEYRELFTYRYGIDVVEHLFLLTSGMQSRIVGEDQILTQVKDALKLARHNDTTDKVLEVLFRMAVTVGKKVRTEVAFSHGNTSAIHGAVEQLKSQNHEIKGQKCLVIGNGEMGRLAAMAFMEAGAEVTMTVRHYHSGKVVIPDGCQIILYGDRYEHMADCKYVVSATSSPNYTITRDRLETVKWKHPIMFIDLAVPRDIECGVEDMEYVIRYDIDSFGQDEMSEEQKEQYAQAGGLVEESLAEFTTWYECKDYVPKIQEISRKAAEDVNWRMGKVYKNLTLDSEVQQEVEQGLLTSSEKVFNKMLFKLRDQVSADVLRDCLEAISQAFED